MKALLTAFLLLALPAHAASPEDDYIAARDKLLAQFKLKEGEQISTRVTNAEKTARAGLERKMRAIIGPSGVKGAPAQGKLSLDTLIDGELGFGLLDGLVFKLKGDTQVLVTTRMLLARWLETQQTVWKDSPEHGMPKEIDAALRTENFYTQALSHDAAVTRYADIPVAAPGVAMLIAHRQDIDPAEPRELIVTALRGERVFIWSAKAAAKSTMIPECQALWTASERKANAIQQKYQASDPKDEKLLDEYTKTQTDGDDAMRKCFGERAKRRPYFPALVKQAQDLVERTR